MKTTPRYPSYAEIQPVLDAMADNPAARMMDSVLADFRSKQVSLARGAKDKEVGELTEPEKFAIAYLAGVRMELRPRETLDHRTLTRFVTEACGIYKVEGKFHVMTATEARHEKSEWL